jgi:hypothetical protein
VPGAVPQAGRAVLPLVVQGAGAAASTESSDPGSPIPIGIIDPIPDAGIIDPDPRSGSRSPIPNRGSSIPIDGPDWRSANPDPAIRGFDRRCRCSVGSFLGPRSPIGIIDPGSRIQDWRSVIRDPAIREFDRRCRCSLAPSCCRRSDRERAPDPQSGIIDPGSTVQDWRSVIRDPAIRGFDRSVVAPLAPSVRLDPAIPDRDHRSRIDVPDRRSVIRDPRDSSITIGGFRCSVWLLPLGPDPDGDHRSLRIDGSRMAIGDRDPAIRGFDSEVSMPPLAPSS